MTMQMQSDTETDQARIERNEWQRAIEDDLRIIRDYIDPTGFICWHPGERKQGRVHAQQVHLTTADSCTCPRFKLGERCQHAVFVRRLEEWGRLPGVDAPVTAREIAT